jgi:hypothetical protein
MAGTQNLGKLTFGGHCVEDEHGHIWVGDQQGLVRLGALGPEIVPLGEDSGYNVLNVLPDGQGRMLAYVGHRSLWRTDGIHTEQLWKQQDMTLGMIEVMYQAPHYLLLGGDRGLVQYDGKTFHTLPRDRFPSLSITTGIVQTPQGDTGSRPTGVWCAIAPGILKEPSSIPASIPRRRCSDCRMASPAPELSQHVEHHRRSRGAGLDHHQRRDRHL